MAAEKVAKDVSAKDQKFAKSHGSKHGMMVHGMNMGTGHDKKSLHHKGSHHHMGSNHHLGMGWGRARGFRRGFGRRVIPRQNLTVADVRQFIERRLAWRGRDLLKVVEFTKKDADTFAVHIVTKKE